MEYSTKALNTETWERSLNCPKCDSKIKIGYKDIYIIPEKNSHERLPRYTCKCPMCNCEIVLNEDEIPSIIKDTLWENMDIIARLVDYYL